MATCPRCGVSSREDPDAIEVELVLAVKKIGTFSLAGRQFKASASTRPRMSCRCGWYVLGRIENGQFVEEES